MPESAPPALSLQYFSKNGWEIVPIPPDGANLSLHAPPVGPFLDLALEKAIPATLAPSPQLRIAPLNLKEKCHARIQPHGNLFYLHPADKDRSVFLRALPLTTNAPLRHADIFHLEDFPIIFRYLPPSHPPILPHLFFKGQKVAAFPFPKKRFHFGNTNRCEVLSLRAPIYGCFLQFAKSRDGLPCAFNMLAGSGALINGQPFREHPLRPGDRISIAGESLLFDGKSFLPQSSIPQPLKASDLFLEHKGTPTLGPLSLQLFPGELVGLFSPPAQGKTTLLRCLGGEISPSSGKVLLGPHPLTPLLHKYPYLLGRASIRNLPDQAHSLLDAFLFHLRLRLPAHLPHKFLLERIHSTCQPLHLTPLLPLHPLQLSASQRRLAAIAIELACQPPYLLLDEPFAGLSPELEATLLLAIRKLADDGSAILLASNRPDPLEACDRILLLANKDIVFDGPPEIALETSGTSSPDELLEFLASTNTFPSSHKPKLHTPYSGTPPPPYRLRPRSLLPQLLRWQLLPRLRSFPQLALLPFLLGLCLAALSPSSSLHSLLHHFATLAPPAFAFLAALQTFPSPHTFRRWRLLGLPRSTQLLSMSLTAALLALPQTLLLLLGALAESALETSALPPLAIPTPLPSLLALSAILALALISAAIAITATALARNPLPATLLAPLWLALLAIGLTYPSPHHPDSPLLNLADTLPSHFTHQILQQQLHSPPPPTPIPHSEPSAAPYPLNPQTLQALLKLAIWLLASLLAALSALRTLESPPNLSNSS